MSIVRKELVRGLKEPGQGELVLLPGKEKQFAAVLEGAETGAVATIKVYACPGSDKERRIDVATLTVTKDAPNDVTPILESLIQGHYAEVVAVTGGAVWVYALSDGGQ